MTARVEPGLLAQVRTDLLGPASATLGAPGRDQIASAVSGARVLGSLGVLRASAAVHAELSGAGPLQALLDVPGTTDVLVNGPRSVWVDRGDGLQAVDADLGSESAVRALAVRLAASVGRRLDDACPWVDARLADGVRLHAVLPPLAERTTICLRVPTRRLLTLEALVAGGSLPAAWAPVMAAIVARRLSFLVTGGTGSGKTTVLAALLGMVPPGERLVIVEDASELAPEHPHVVRLQGRPGNVEGVGAVALRDLVRQALRMRPDRLVVGEVRGAEVRDLLAALNTGHDGGCGTVHANSPADVPARLEALAALAGLDRQALAAQAASAVQVVVHLRREGPVRRITHIAIVRRDGGGHLEVVPALSAGPSRAGPSRAEPSPAEPGVRGPGWPALSALLGGSVPAVAGAAGRDGP